MNRLDLLNMETDKENLDDPTFAKFMSQSTAPTFTPVSNADLANGKILSDNLMNIITEANNASKADAAAEIKSDKKCDKKSNTDDKKVLSHFFRALADVIEKLN